MSNSTKLSWSAFVTAVQKMVKMAPTPYVSELALSQSRDQYLRAYWVLISTIISLRTKDAVTAKASTELFKLADTPQTMIKLKASQIEKAIYPCGFYRVKAKNIKEVSKIILNQYHGQVPDNLEKLLSLPGVGRKTANLVLIEGFHKDGICVDTHVHRIMNRMGYVTTKVPDETEMVLRKILPNQYWQMINCLLVTFGQNHCKPVRPKCETCLLQKDCRYHLSKNAH